MEKGPSKAEQNFKVLTNAHFSTTFPSLIRPSPQTPSPDSRNSRLQNADPGKLVSVEASMEHPSFSSCTPFAAVSRCVVSWTSSRQRGIVSVELDIPRRRRGDSPSTQGIQTTRDPQSSYSYTPPVRSGTIGHSVITQLMLSGPDRSPTRRQQSHTLSSVSRHMHDTTYSSDVYLDLKVFGMY